ncbi:MAG: CDP-alcohol phosphatidyltransferase family protein [Lentimicrobiaceae bacterium]
MNRMNFKSHIPNTITLLNLLSGSLSVILLLKGFVIEAAFLVGLAAVFDFLDGLSARLFNAKSPIGKELDSLADVISFGLVPSLFLYYLMSQNPMVINGTGLIVYTPYLALLIAAYSGLRLAKFNLDTRQYNTFLGLPVPANAMFIVPLAIIASLDTGGSSIVSTVVGNFWFQLAVIPVSCFLLVSEIPMFALKFTKGFGLKGNMIRYSFLLISLLMILLLGWAGISLSIVVYILMSVVFEDK